MGVSRSYPGSHFYSWVTGIFPSTWLTEHGMDATEVKRWPWDWTWRCRAIFLAIRETEQEDHKLRVVVSCKMSPRPAGLLTETLSPIIK